MSGHEVLGCVDLIAAAFDESSQLLSKLSRKHKKHRGERGQHESLLFDVLASGAAKVRAQYTVGFKQYGIAFQHGDENTRERLLRVAVDMHSEIVRSLQLACEQDWAVLNLIKLHEKALISRHDAIRSLEELTERLESSWPLPLPSPDISSSNSSVSSTGYKPSPLSTVWPPNSLNSPFLAELPAAINIQDPPPRPGFKRFFSRNGSVHRRSNSNEENKPEIQIVCTPPDPAPAAKAASKRRSTSGSSSKKAFERLQKLDHPDYPDSRRRSIQSVKSIEHPEAVELPTQRDSVIFKSESPSDISRPPTTAGLSIADAMLPLVTSFTEQKQKTIAELDDTSSISTRDYDTASLYSQAEQSPSTPVTPTLTPISPSPTTALDLPPISHQITPISEEEEPDHRSTSSLSLTSSNNTPQLSSTSDFKPVLGRPSKANNYHNFCKGAWAVRTTSPSAGLALKLLPSNISTSDSGLSPHWQCKWCAFHSPALQPSATPRIPDKIYISSQGIAYTFLFLLRSHASVSANNNFSSAPIGDAASNPNWPLAPPTLSPHPSTNTVSTLKNSSEDAFAGCSFGCIFCSLEGKESAVYTDVEGLMGHVDSVHAGRMTAEVAVRARCIDGRVAERGELIPSGTGPRGEKWDVNICRFEV